MVEQICNKCNIKKDISEFEFRKDRNTYRKVCKQCKNNAKKINYQLKKDEINQKRRLDYQLKKDEINQKRRLDYQINKDAINEKRRLNHHKATANTIQEKIKKQLKGTIDRTFTRKQIKRDKSYEELLCVSIDDAVNYLIADYYDRHYPTLTLKDEVDIDHIFPIWLANSKETIEDTCNYKNLRLLPKKANHRKGGKIYLKDKDKIKEWLEFSKKNREDKKCD